MGTIFHAFDGEAIDDQYCLLADKQYNEYSRTRLDTETCLGFLWERLATNETGVFYGMHYDVVNILQDLSPAQIQSLNETNETTYSGCLITYFPKKILSLKIGRVTKKFYDVAGFFQQSFESTMQQMLGVTDDTISRGKAARATFTRQQWREIIKYNRLECTLLERICDKLAEVTQDFEIKSWHGASAISTSVLKKQSTVSTNRDREIELDNDNIKLIRSGYYGGRIEALQLGHIQNCVSYDIVSAYPSAMLTLPELLHFSRHKTYEADRQGYYTIQYRSALSETRAPAPFPVRWQGRILFPSSGETTITSHELAAFYALCETHPHLYDKSHVKILDAITVPNKLSDLRHVVRELFDKRKTLKSAGDVRQMAYKLALNSMYGKFAQRVGHPRFNVYFWAGLITGHCRAAVLRLAAHNINNIVMFATDSITFSKPVKIAESKDLGGLELAHSGSLDVLMSGMYAWSDGSEAKMRGFKGLPFREAYSIINCLGEYIHNGRVLVGFNPPRSLAGYRGRIIPYPKRLRLTSNMKREYDNFEIDLNTERTLSRPWPTTPAHKAEYAIDDWNEPDVIEL